MTTTKRTPVPSWTPKSDKSKHRCGGACGRMLPARKFPTDAACPGHRAGECRECRDTRLGRRV
jgi:hypothetical protein